MMSEYFVLCLILKGKFSIFTTEYDISCRVFKYGLYAIQAYPFYTNLVEFLPNIHWLLSKSLFTIS